MLVNQAPPAVERPGRGRSTRHLRRTSRGTHALVSHSHEKLARIDRKPNQSADFGLVD